LIASYYFRHSLIFASKGVELFIGLHYNGRLLALSACIRQGWKS
jgi:hypothetical protein